MGIPQRRVERLYAWLPLLLATHVTVGVLHISGLFLRLVVVVLWFPLNLTLPFLGMVELLGHMPIYATIVILFIFGSGRSEPVPAEQVHGG